MLFVLVCYVKSHIIPVAVNKVIVVIVRTVGEGPLELFREVDLIVGVHKEIDLVIRVQEVNFVVWS